MDGLEQIVIHVLQIFGPMARATHVILGGLVLTVTCVTQILDPQDHVIPVHWRIQGGAPGTRAPPRGPNSFIFMQFSAKM